MKMLFLSGFFLLAFTFSFFGQVNHWENIVQAEDNWNYLVPFSQPDADWNSISYDDSTWDVGPGGFGYGDEDDNTELLIPYSIYLRKSFEVSSIAAIEALIFNMDFDDGFVAYLNGTEIARVNVLGTPPNFDQDSEINIEAVMYDGGYPSTHDITEFIDLLVTGENLLAIEVHNTNATSSDFSAIPFLHVGLNTEELLYSEPLNWFNPPFGCSGGLEESYTVTLTTETWGAEITWEIHSFDNEVLYSYTGFEDWSDYPQEICLPNDCYHFYLIDSYGDGWNGGSISMIDFEGNEVLSGDLPNGDLEVITISLNGDCIIPGCTDTAAINYYPYANEDDGSCLVFTETNLPLVLINTGDAEIEDDYRIVCDMGIINNPDEYNSLDDPFTDYDGKIAIEYRGSSSQSFPKKSFALETQDEFGENNNVSLLGMPSENDWILHGPFSDKSLMRNVITFELGRKIGRYTPRTKYCELFINGDYRGVYLLMENIKRDVGRVDIATLLPEDISGNELTGGYILKIDKTTGDFNGGWTSPYQTVGGNDMFIQFHKPEIDDLNETQQEYIQDHITSFEEVLSNDNFADTETGYSNFIDIPSFMDLYFINELSRNIDGYRLSTYFYKQKDSNGGKIVMGPWWDYNLSFGNADYCDGISTEGWEVEAEECGQNNPFWFDRLLEDENYESELKCRWTDFRANEWSDESIELLIDSLENRLGAAQERNYLRWPVLGNYVWPNAFVGNTYDEELTFLKEWTASRLAWLDQNLLSECVAGCSNSLACNYDPEVTYDNDSCIFPEEFYDCDGNCLLDSDSDLVCDEIDNCPLLYNPDQEDVNDNGIGDVCEGTSISGLHPSISPILIKITDLLGRVVSTEYKGVVFYHYNDGSIVKTIIDQ